MKTIQVSDERWEEIKESYADSDFIYCVGCKRENHMVGKPGAIALEHTITRKKEYWEDCLLVIHPDGQLEGVAHLECEGLVRGNYPDTQIQRIRA